MPAGAPREREGGAMVAGPDRAGVAHGLAGAAAAAHEAVAAHHAAGARFERAGGTPAAKIVQGRRRRRPSGEPPPLPRQLNASGKWWLALAAAVCGFWIFVVITPRTALALAVADTWVLEHIAALR